jgi:hypothetical protein
LVVPDQQVVVALLAGLQQQQLPTAAVGPAAVEPVVMVHPAALAAAVATVGAVKLFCTGTSDLRDT